jgi:carbonic anhydrase
MIRTGMIGSMAVLIVGASASGGGALPDMCHIGYSQSPISLARCSDNNGVENRFSYPVERDELSISLGSGLSKLELIDLDGGKVLKITPEDPEEMGTFSVEAHGSKKEYQLAYCLVHAGSDHTIELTSDSNGRYPAEIQCFGHMTGGTTAHPVHRMGAISVMLANGQTEDAEGTMAETSSPFIGQFALEDMPTLSTAVDMKVNFGRVEGTAGLTRYWTYSGSERLAPCTENVDWYVLYDPAGISNAQLELLTNAGIAAAPKPMAHHNGRHPDGCPAYHAGATSMGAWTWFLLVAAIAFGRL